MRAILPVLWLLTSCATAPITSSIDLTVDGHVVAEIVNAPYDPAAHTATCKVYHRVYAPDGRLLTKDLGGEYEHHRGLFVGWNQMRCRGQQYDFWHCHNGETQRFVGFVDGKGMNIGEGAQVAAIEWRAKDGSIVLHERRALGAERLADDAYLLVMTNELRADDDVVLAGDPQHAGQQFRALQLFAEKGATGVRFLRPPGAKAQPNDVWTDCDWTAAVLPLPTGPVTVLRVEGADNPKPTLWSTRTYGRFGATFSTTIAAGATLRILNRYVVALGARDAAWCAATAASVAARR